MSEPAPAGGRVEGLTRISGASLRVTRAALEAAGADPAGWEPLPPPPVRAAMRLSRYCAPARGGRHSGPSDPVLWSPPMSEPSGP